MAQWQILKAGIPTLDPLFDDGEFLSPGEDGFSSTSVHNYCSAQGSDYGYNFVGVPKEQAVE